MKKIFSNHFFVFLFLFISASFFAPQLTEAAVITSTATGGLWTAGATWVGGVAPLNADSVVIATTGGNSVTIGAAVTNAGLTVNSGGILEFTGAFTLTENGNVSVSGTIKGATGILKMNANPLEISGNGTINSAIMIQQPVSIIAGSNLTATGIITLANTFTIAPGAILSAVEIDSNAKTVANNGTVNLSGNYLRTGGVAIWTQGTNAVVNIGGSFTPSANITLSASASGNTVNYNGAAQAVQPASYANMIFSGTGEKTIITGTSVGGNLSIAPTGAATANIGAGLTITANSLTLGGLGRINGTWGSTSSAATNKTNTYFSATTGILSVTADMRSAPTLSVTNSPVTYSGSPQAAAVSGSVPGSVSGIKYDGSATAPTNVGTYAITADFVPTDGTSYTSLTSASAGNFVINSAPGDTTAPVVVSFIMPKNAASFIVPVSSFTATDNIAVTGYLITESASTPSGSNPYWSVSAPTSFAFSSSGPVTAYAWARDAAGNISASVSAAVTIAFPAAGSFSGGGPNVMPTTLDISGKAYPGGKLILITKLSAGVISGNKIPVSPAGDFNFVLAGIIQGNYIYSLLAEDQDGLKSQVKVFNVDFISNSIFEKNIIISPTIRIENPSVHKGGLLKAGGYAYPNSKVILNLGDINYSTMAAATGRYEFSINTSLIDSGSHFIRTKQIDIASLKESDWSPTKNFEVQPSFIASLDFNGDGIINIEDWSIFLSRSKSSDSKIIGTIDFNQDGKIDISDFSIFLRNFKNK